MPYIQSSQQFADLFTRGVSNKVFNFFVDKLDMRNIYAPT